MTIGGWITMILSVGGATVFFALCIFRVKTTRENHAANDEPEDENLDTDDDTGDSSGGDGKDASK